MRLKNYSTNSLATIWFIASTTVVGGPSTALYVAGRLSGELPDPQGWLPNNDSVLGPWWHTWQGAVLQWGTAGMAVLGLLTFILGGVFICLRPKTDYSHLVLWVGFGILQFWAALEMFGRMSWVWF